jgi:hypothetical protein
MIILPYAPRRSLLFAFWWMFNLTLVFIMCIINLAFFPHISLFIWFLPPILLLLFVGYQWKAVPYFFYNAWNKIDRIVVSKHCRMVLLFIIYAIFTLVSMAGSRLRLGRPNTSGSMWSPASDENEYSAIMKQNNGKEWVKPFIYWARKSNNLWIFWLLPFFLLISVFQDQKTEKGTADSNIYTLF